MTDGFRFEVRNPDQKPNIFKSQLPSLVVNDTCSLLAGVIFHDAR